MESVAGAPVVGDDLFGREQELAHIWRMLERGAHVLMTAPRRAGKTSLMRELERGSRDGWIVAYADVEACTEPVDIVAEILGEIAKKKEFKKRYRDKMSNLFDKVADRVGSISVSIFKAEIRSAVKSNWKREAEKFQNLLRSSKPKDSKLLIIIDELPIPINNMLKNEQQRREAEIFLSWLRKLRQDQKLRNRVHTLIGGSIGMEGVMRRMGKSSLINDMKTYHLPSWSKETAAKFLRKLSEREQFQLDESSIEEMLALLQDPIPYHVHLFFEKLPAELANKSGTMPAGLIKRCFDEQLAGFQGTAHLEHYKEKLESIFETKEEMSMAHEILKAACMQQNGIKSDIDATNSEGKEATQLILNELIAEKFLAIENGNIRFYSNLLRCWWRKQVAGVRT